MLALQHGSGGSHVGQLAVGAGTDDDLVDGNVLALGCGMSVLRQVGICHGAVHLTQIDLDGALILGVLVGLKHGPGTDGAAFHISQSHIVHGEDAVLGAGLDGHVGNGQTVIDAQVCNAGACKLQRLIAGTVHADHADQGQDHVLAGDIGLQFAGEVHLDGRGNLEPGLAGCHGGAQIGGADAGGECAQSAVSAGVGVSADHGIAGANQTLFGQQGMLDTHSAHIEIVVDVEALCKGAALLALGCGLDVLVGGEMVHDHCDAALIKHLIETGCLKLVDGNRGGDVIAQNQIQLCLDQLACTNFRQTCVGGQDLLCHCHAHRIGSSL